MSNSPKNPVSADAIYAQKITQVEDFRFDESVAQVFTDMINRSIPSYADLVKYIGLIARRYVTENSRVYDLGCSLGAVSLSIDQSLPDMSFDIVALDNSEAMLTQLQEVTKNYKWQHAFQTIQSDIQDFGLSNNSLTVMNFVLQFLPPSDRKAMLDKIYTALNPGGALILSEKIKLSSDQDDQLIFALHHDFKRSEAYSDLEISQKRNALEHAMQIDFDSDQVTRLKSVGFSQVIKWFQAFNFVSYLAIK